MFEQSDNVDPCIVGMFLWRCYRVGPSSENELQNEAPQSAPQSRAQTPKKR
jgi:hypothetical protein